jgi:hypothetical protein
LKLGESTGPRIMGMGQDRSIRLICAIRGQAPPLAFNTPEALGLRIPALPFGPG